MKHYLLALLTLCISTTSWSNSIESFESHGDIHLAVTQFLESKLRHQEQDYKIELKSLDHRLQLAKCSLPLELVQPAGSRDMGLTSIGVKCNRPKPWLIYISAHIKLFHSVAILTTTKDRGSILTKKDVRLKRVELSRAKRRYFTNIEDVIGKIAKRTVFAGDILTMDQLTQPKAVRRGEQIIILANNHGMNIRMSGSAMTDGSRGQRISVRNNSSRRIVEGVVIAPGIVQIRF